MYNTNYKCTYHKNNLETNFSQDEYDYITDIMYKDDLINIFGLKENDEFDCLNDILSETYENIKNNKDLKECMILAASKLFSEDEQIGLCILHSYDYLYLTHDCISEYIKTNSISQEKIKNLIDCLNK
jgi:hypothetical protein